jgi:amidase
VLEVSTPSFFVVCLVKEYANRSTIVIPISEHQDTVGPITKSLTDAAIVLSVISGKDPNDNYTLAQPSVVPDFTKALNKNALKGRRIGVPRREFLNDSVTENDPFVNVIFEQALQTIRDLGATVIDPADLPSADEILNSQNETVVLKADSKVCSVRLVLFYGC